MEFGAWDGMTFTEVAEQHKAELDAWLGSLDVAPGGGESFRDVEKRVLDGLQRLLEAHAGTHGRRRQPRDADQGPGRARRRRTARVGVPDGAQPGLGLGAGVLRRRRGRRTEARASMRMFNALPPGREAFASPYAALGPARQDDELLGRPGHRDVAVDGPFDAVAERVRVDQDDQVELEALRQLRGQRPDARRAGSASPSNSPTPMTQAIPSACSASQASRIESRSDVGSVHDGYAGAADRGRHVGVREHGPDDRLGLRHDLFRRPVVDAQRRQVDVVEPDPREPFLPRLGEPVPGLGAVADDGEAAGRAADAAASATRRRSAPGPRRRRCGRTDRRAGRGRSSAVRPRRPGLAQVLAAQHRHHLHLGVVGRDQVVDDPVHLLALGGDGGLVPTPAPRRLGVAEPLPGRVEQRQVGHRPRVRAVRGAAAAGPRRGRARARTCAGRRAPTTGRRRGRSARSAATPG